jgi:hypothetical protein
VPASSTTTRRVRRSAALLLCAAGLLAGCASSEPVAPEARAVKPAAETADWKPAQTATLLGTWHSRLVEGEPAASLLGLYYHFSADGSYAGAALVAGSPPAFQVQNGHWSLAAGRLTLDEGEEPATLEEAPGMLRLTTSQGRVIFDRDESR